MDLDALSESPIGQLVPITGNDGRTGVPYRSYGFLTNPLPSSISLTSSTWTAVTEAEAALARLDQASQQLPDPRVLRQPSLRREAQSTSALEGTFAPFEDVLESDIDERAQLSLEVREVLNYVVAAEEAFSWIDERPLTTGLIANLQRILVQGTPGEYTDAGRVRDRQVVIGPRDAPIENARFVPPPPGDQLQAGLEQWVDWVNNPPDDIPSVVQAALAHYQFEALHPFSDGNGRIGRLLIVLQLMRQQRLRDAILVVSPWFEERRVEYQDGLLTLSETGNWDTWVEFFATGVGTSAQTTLARVERLLAWQDETIKEVRRARAVGTAERIASDLIGTPVLRASQVARRHGVSHQGAMNALRRLAELGIIEERQRRGRVVFVAPAVVDLLSQ
ncbi:MAG: Fic family protein [Actinomycetota bacterium]|nr:Fic family protein [Actinomycetota bacterium]